MEPIFSLNYTSCRANAIQPAVLMWRQLAINPDTVEVVISVDSNNPEAITAARAVPNAKVVIQSESPFNCVKGWNLGAASTTGKVLINVADDFSPPQHWDTLLLSLNPPGWVDGEYVVHTEDGYVHDIAVLSIATRKRYQRFGYMLYPGYESMFCLHPDTEIYMADFSFKPIGSIVPGDKIVGTTKTMGSRGTGKQARERLTESVVKEVHSKNDELLEIAMLSGKVLRCTGDHLWAYYADSKLTNYGIPKVGRKLVKVLNVPGVPPIYSDRDMGWLSGIFDGEGCFPVIVQSPTVNPEICMEIERILTKFKFPYQVTDQVQRGQYLARTFTLIGGRNEYVRFINWLDPVKRNSRQVKNRLLSARFGQPDEIVSIRSIGQSKVFCLSTSTKNYIADGYLSHNSDTEFTTVAYRDGVVIQAKQLLFEHMHCDCGKRAKDEHDVVHGSKERWNRGEMLFNYRKQTGFPIDEGPNANVDNSARHSEELRFAVYIQATKDDFCLYEVCRRMMDEGARDFFFCVPDEYWSGKQTPMEDIAQVRAISDRISQEGATSHFQVFDVSQYRFSGDSRIAVETRVRNDTLGWIRRSGFQHILIVDGDELWVKGLLEKVRDVVLTSKPTCISAPMIPVVGHPGYPVHQASDRAVIYIDSTTTFRECRSPATEHFLLNNGIVIHFTACRKTLQDVIDKHRASGHYDDPEYDFEGWIKNVLPNLKPGWKGAHMYRRYQIWPTVRNWAKEEIEHIPENLRQYLGPPLDTPSPIQHVLTPLSKAPPGERVRPPQSRKINDLKVTPFRLTQLEQFIGAPLNPYRK